MTRSRALVTGGAGFLGRHFADELERRGWDVVTVDVRSARVVDLFPGGRMPSTSRVHILQDARAFFARELTDVSRTAPDPFDLVVHCAAAAPHRRAIDTRHDHLAYDVSLDAMFFDWAVRTGQRRLLYVSSSAVYPVALQTGELRERDGTPARLSEVDVSQSLPPNVWAHLAKMVLPPDANYGWTKLIGEAMAERTTRVGTPVTVVRPFSGYGEDQGTDWPFGAFVDRARRREDPFTIWGSDSQVRDWIHVSDVVAGALELVDAEVTEPVNICTGVGTSVRELANLVIHHSRHDEGEYDPVLHVDRDAPLGVHHRVGNPARLERWYRPIITLDEGVRRALADKDTERT